MRSIGAQIDPAVTLLAGHLVFLGVLASLGRPEVWPFLGLYAIWAWRAKRARSIAARRSAAEAIGRRVRSVRRLAPLSRGLATARRLMEGWVRIP